MTITKSQPYSLIVTDLDFGDNGKAEGSVKFEDTGNAVIVAWSFNGDAGMNLVNRYFGAMLDYFVGPYFESGQAPMLFIRARSARRPERPEKPTDNNEMKRLVF